MNDEQKQDTIRRIEEAGWTCWNDADNLQFYENPAEDLVRLSVEFELDIIKYYRFGQEHKDHPTISMSVFHRGEPQPILTPSQVSGRNLEMEDPHMNEEGTKEGPDEAAYVKWAKQLLRASTATDRNYQGHPDPMAMAASALRKELGYGLAASLFDSLREEIGD